MSSKEGWDEKYPESTKVSRVSEESQSIGQFLEWLEESGRTIYRYQEAGNNGEPKWIDKWYDGEPVTEHERTLRVNNEDHPKHRHPNNKHPGGNHWNRFDWNPLCGSWDAGYYPEYGMYIERLLAEYFGIDLQKKAEEQNRMLEELREANKGK